MARSPANVRTAPSALPPKDHNFRAPPGRAVAMGRDGKPIYRQSSSTAHDPFAIDPSIVPDGWVYEWKRYSIYNQVDHTHQARLARIGRWTPVPASRHDGMFLPPGSDGAIIHDGLILMERPAVLHQEAMMEEKMTADAAMRRAKSERALAPASSGVSTNTIEARQATFMRQSAPTAEDIAALNDLPRGNYDYDRNTID